MMEAAPLAGMEPGEVGDEATGTTDQIEMGALAHMASIDSIVGWFADRLDADRVIKPMHKYQKLAQAWRITCASVSFFSCALFVGACRKPRHRIRNS